MTRRSVCRLHAHSIATTISPATSVRTPALATRWITDPARRRHRAIASRMPVRRAVRAHQRVIGTGHLVQRLGGPQLGAHDLDPGVRDARRIGGSRGRRAAPARRPARPTGSTAPARPTPAPARNASRSARRRKVASTMTPVRGARGGARAQRGVGGTADVVRVERRAARARSGAARRRLAHQVRAEDGEAGRGGELVRRPWTCPTPTRRRRRSRAARAPASAAERPARGAAAHARGRAPRLPACAARRATAPPWRAPPRGRRRRRRAARRCRGRRPRRGTPAPAPRRGRPCPPRGAP